MSQESKIEEFEYSILPSIREDVLKILEYFEQKELPSAYSSCLQMYLANFMGLSAKAWDEHCSDYGIEMDFEAINSAIENVKSLDEYVKDFS